MLCTDCEKLLQRIADGERHGKSQLSLDGWRASVNKSCTICYCLKPLFINPPCSHEHSVHGLVFYSVSYGCKNGNGQTIPEVSYTRTFECGQLASFSFKLIPINPHNILLGDSSVPPLQMKAESTGDELVLEQVNSWLQSCRHNHACGKNLCSNTSFWPPRLLQIQEGIIRLIDRSAFHVDKEPYATLSYRWGVQPKHLKLTPETASRLRNGLEVEKLPKTFQDAVKITKSLHLRFLWIDSLCIIQSGPEHLQDWHEHVGKMALVFQNGTINIAAADSQNAEEGILVTRQTAPLLQTLQDVIDYRDDSCLLPDELYWICDQPSWNRLIGRFPLDTRGWVYQERSLSPRTVLFSKDQVYWECREYPATICELLPTRENSVRETTLSLLQFAPKSWNRVNKVNFYQEWVENLSRYSRTTLTKSEDKLPAFAGIARQLAEGTDSYVAGLFRSSLPWSLLWKPESTAVRRTQGPYRAPTWSWAAYDGAICYILLRFSALGENYRPMVKDVAVVRDIKASFANSKDRFGAVLSAEILLHGPTLTVSWRKEGKQGTFTPQTYQIRIPSSQHSFQQSNDLPNHDAQKLLWESQHYDGVSLMLDIVTEHSIYSEAVLLILCQDSVQLLTENASDHQRLLGLMLAPSKEQADKWIRIGTFMISGGGDVYGTLVEVGLISHSLAII